MYNSKLCWKLSCFSFCDCWICFNFCFCFFFGIPIVITSSAIGLKTCAITAGIEKYKSIVKRKKKKRNEIVSLAKAKLNNIEVLISKVSVDSSVSNDECAKTTKRYEERNKKCKDLNNFFKYFSLFMKENYLIIWSAEKIQKVKRGCKD